VPENLSGHRNLTQDKSREVAEMDLSLYSVCQYCGRDDTMHHREAHDGGGTRHWTCHYCRRSGEPLSREEWELLPELHAMTEANRAVWKTQTMRALRVAAVLRLYGGRDVDSLDEAIAMSNRARLLAGIVGDGQFEFNGRPKP